jgi:hypothetical protein
MDAFFSRHDFEFTEQGITAVFYQGHLSYVQHDYLSGPDGDRPRFTNVRADGSIMRGDAGGIWGPGFESPEVRKRFVRDLSQVKEDLLDQIGKHLGPGDAVDPQDVSYITRSIDLMASDKFEYLEPKMYSRPNTVSQRSRFGEKALGVLESLGRSLRPFSNRQ